MDPSEIGSDGKHADLQDRFFDGDGASLHPVEVDTFEDLFHKAEPLSPELALRRRRLRRVVAAVVGFAGLIGLFVLTRLALAPSPPVDPPGAILAAQPAVPSVDLSAADPVASGPDAAAR
jgi:hypothetical protein